MAMIQTWLLFCLVYLKVQSLVLFYFWYISMTWIRLWNFVKLIISLMTQTYFSKSITKLNKYVNLDVKNRTDWLNANKISLNVQETELVIFKHQRKKLDGEVKIKLSRKRLCITDSVEYLVIRIDKYLN